jgi:hypothetical protein
MQKDEVMMPPFTMDDLLKDETLFRNKFCAEATVKHLGNVPVEALRAAIQMIHGCSVFRAASTPITFGGGGDGDMPVVIFGCLTIDGQMRTPRFGLTTQCSGSNQPPGEKLFLYVSKTMLIGEHADKIVSAWLPWRENTSDPSFVMPVPIWENKSLSAASKISINFSETITQSGFLKIGKDMALCEFLQQLGYQLNLRHEVKESFAKTTKNCDLAFDCITPRAVEIMRARRR